MDSYIKSANVGFLYFFLGGGLSHSQQTIFGTNLDHNLDQEFSNGIFTIVGYGKL